MNAFSDSMSEGKIKVNLTIPALVVIMCLTWVVSAGVTYGVISTRIEWLDQRVDTLEKNEGNYLPRNEYEAISRDTDQRLDRIERKIDSLYLK